MVEVEEIPQLQFCRERLTVAPLVAHQVTGQTGSELGTC